MSEKRRIADGPNVFALPSAELWEMIKARVANLRANLAKVEAQRDLERAQEETEKAAGIVHGARFASRREVMESAMKGLQRSIEEFEFLAAHVAPQEQFVMSAAELLSFRSAFASWDVDVDRMILAANEGPQPDQQAERSLKSTLVQIPRIALPHGMVG